MLKPARHLFQVRLPSPHSDVPPPHYQGHWLSATAFLVNATGNRTVAAAAEGVMRVYETVVAAWAAKYGDDGYLFPFDPLVWDALLAGRLPS